MIRDQSEVTQLTACLPKTGQLNSSERLVQSKHTSKQTCLHVGRKDDMRADPDRALVVGCSIGTSQCYQMGHGPNQKLHFSTPVHLK